MCSQNTRARLLGHTAKGLDSGAFSRKAAVEGGSARQSRSSQQPSLGVWRCREFCDASVLASFHAIARIPSNYKEHPPCGPDDAWTLTSAHPFPFLIAAGLTFFDFTMHQNTALLLLAAIPATYAAVPAWGQCGGSGYSGETTCVSGYTCVTVNQWYSQVSDIHDHVRLRIGTHLYAVPARIRRPHHDARHSHHHGQRHHAELDVWQYRCQVQGEGQEVLWRGDGPGPTHERAERGHH